MRKRNIKYKGCHFFEECENFPTTLIDGEFYVCNDHEAITYSYVEDSLSQKGVDRSIDLESRDTFIKRRFQSFTIKKLKKICKIDNIKGFSKYTKKKDLIRYVVQNLSNDKKHTFFYH
jgi:hypothetical protein